MSHLPSDFAKVKVERANTVVIGPSFGLSTIAVCAQTTPVAPMTRHCGLIWVALALSLFANVV